MLSPVVTTSVQENKYHGLLHHVQGTSYPVFIETNHVALPPLIWAFHILIYHMIQHLEETLISIHTVLWVSQHWVCNRTQECNCEHVPAWESDAWSEERALGWSLSPMEAPSYLDHWRAAVECIVSAITCKVWIFVTFFDNKNWSDYWLTELVCYLDRPRCCQSLTISKAILVILYVAIQFV